MVMERERRSIVLGLLAEVGSSRLLAPLLREPLAVHGPDESVPQEPAPRTEHCVYQRAFADQLVIRDHGASS